MSPRSFLLTEAQAGYLAAHCEAPDGVQKRLIDETRSLGAAAQMQISPDEGALITLLARVVAAKSALELGTFTGYSALCIARGLTAGGTLVCCDVSEEWTSVARRYWKEAGVEGAIDLRIGPAAGTLRAMPEQPAFDLVFIDADKPSYPEYWQLVVPRVRPGGIILADNVLRGGEVVDCSVHNDAVDAIRRFNDTVAADSRVESVLLPVADGLTLARRK